MKKENLIYLTCLFCMSSFSAAESFSFMDLLDPKPELDISQPDPKRTCVDFSGSWKGTCKVKEQSLDESVTIKQNGCEILEVTGREGKTVALPIGGVLHASAAIPGEPGMTGSGSINSNWNADHSELQIIMGKSGKKLEVDKPVQGKMVSQKVKLTEGKLAVEFTAYHNSDKTTGTCEFNKQ